MPDYRPDNFCKGATTMKSPRAFRDVFFVFGLLLMGASPTLAQTSHRPALAADRLMLAGAPSPFADNNGQVPPKGDYSGPLFKLSAAWPRAALPPLNNPPWQLAIGGGRITVQNAQAYTNALRDYVARDAKALIAQDSAWNAATAGWYNEPWLGSLRESISGTYAAGEFGPEIFPSTGLRATFSTHVLTYYDARAAHSLYKVWGTTARTPALQTSNFQFEEGSVIVKAAVFASTDPQQPTDWWDALKGAQVWQLYLDPTDPANPQPTAPRVWPSYVAQFDIIVKDSKAAPRTGWVFTTLVFDADAPGDVWEKMIPLGAQWGNDPQATQAGQPLVENWINPNAPKYSTQTLGWGGRLSGPNDGARNDIAVGGRVLNNEPDSSCMSCHSTAQWNVARHRMDAFLLPSFSQASPPGFQLCGDNGKPDPNGSNICSPAPGSTAWLAWFQDRLGTQPMSNGSLATDFDEVFSFKTLPMWWRAMNPALARANAMPMPNEAPLRFNQYTGAPLKGHPRQD
jgi:hypothetical protein